MESFEKSEKTAEEWFELGVREIDPEKQVKYYTKALEINPKYDRAWSFKGFALNNLGRYEEAIICYDKLLEINPNDALVALIWNKKCLALNDLKRYEEAIECFDRVLEIKPKDVNAWHNKGIVFINLKRNEEAIKCFDNALEIDPKDVTWHNKGDALLNLKRYKKAIRCCDKALEINPNFEEAKNNKKTAEEKLKKEKEAGFLWKMPFIPKKSRIRGLLKKEDTSMALEKFSSDRDFIPTLIELLYDSNANVRKGAAFNIGVIAIINPDLIKSAIPRLIKLLDDSDRDVREMVNPAISHLTRKPELFKDEVPRLIKLLADPNKCQTAASVIGLIGEPDLVKDAIPRLIELLDIPYARKNAVYAIGNIGEANPDLVKDAFPKLINLLDEPSVREAAIFAIEEIGKKRPDLIEGTAPKLSNLLSDEQKIVSNAGVIGFLGQINLDLVKDVISKLKEFLNSSDKDVRENAVRAVMIVAERKPELVKDAFPRLIELLDDPDVRVWAASAITVVTKKPPELFKDVVPKLTELLDDSNISVSYDAAIAIGNICGATRLVELLCDFDVREKAVSAILHAIEVATEKTPQLFKDAVPKLIELSGDTNLCYKDDRMTAIFALGNICGASALPHLEKLLDDNLEDTALNYFIKTVIEEIKKRIKTSKQGIESAKRALEEAKAFGCEISDVEDILNKAKSSFHAEYHVNAIEYAREAEEIAKKRKEKSKPEIAISFSEYQFLPETWKKIEMFLANKGKAHAKEIKIDFPAEIETKGLQTISNLNVGEEKSLEVGLRPKIIGEIPLDVKIGYKDLDGREYSQSESFWINVALEEESQIGIAEQGMNKLTIERTIYDPCKRDFIEGKLPRMKEWVNSYDPSAYWFAISLQNNTDKAIEEWGVELETSAALKIKEAKIGGIEIEIPHEVHINSFKISVPKEYGIVIPKGGAQRVYFKLRAEKPKTTYELSGVFKSKITGDVPIRAKEFKYLCDTGVSPEAVKVELKKTFSEKEAARLALSFKTVQEIDRMCNQEAKTEEYLDKLSVLKNYTEGFSNTFTNQVEEFAMFMKEEQSGYLDDEYKGKVRRFCTNLVDVWINEFLKG